MASVGKVAGSTATGAALGSVAGPWGTAIGAGAGLLYGLFSGDGSDNTAPAPPPSQYGGNPLTDQLAAQQYAAGLQQQQAQNAREAALYGNANGNFDVANAAQLRQGPQIASSLADKQRQLAALGGTNTAIGNINQTGSQLTALGTQPMGPSYAEAQLRQGQDAAMAQQLAMARSGRSLGSGQAAMNQAAFNNAALNQQTNLAAANARIQEQNNYNQFQLGALGAAGQQYGAAGALSGQAGNQATGIRQGNENVQLQNAQLAQSQQGINNQTTGLYNQLGAQQQQLGMQANTLGQNAFQFGANQASGALGAQLNADTGRLSASTATNIANQQNSNLHDAANMNAVATGLGTVASMANSGGSENAASPSPDYSNITLSSHTAGNGTPNNSSDRLSDENNKKNVVPMQGTAEYADYQRQKQAAYNQTHASDTLVQSQDDPNSYTFTSNGKTEQLNFPHGINSKMDDENLGKIAVTGEAQAPIASYAETIAALNNGYRASQFAPTDVLNRVPGAGAGHSASQDAVIAQMMAKPPSGAAIGSSPVKVSDLESIARQQGLSRVIPTAAPGAMQLNLGGRAPTGQRLAMPQGTLRGPSTVAAPIAAPAPAPAWGDVFNAPTLAPNVAAYLAGANPAATPATGQLHYSGAAPDSAYTQPSSYTDEAPYKVYSPTVPYNTDVVSDARSKTRIRELESQLAALQGPPTASFAPQQPDTAALDAAYAQQQQAPAIDLRPARGYSYEYKDPTAPGAAPGRHVGPMAQDLLKTAAASSVKNTPNGLKVDTPGLTMTNTAAISELQRKMAQLEALGGGQPAPAAYNPNLYPAVR